MGALLEAANRGIKVRILADGFESWTAMEWNPYFMRYLLMKILK